MAHGFKAWLGCLTALALAAGAPAGEDPHFLYHSLDRRPYFQHKYGFANVVEAKNHAYKEFLREVQAGRLDPRDREYFSYIYTILNPQTRRITYFHSQWEPAVFLKNEAGMEQYEVRSPIAETANIRKNSMLHSHPAGAVNGEGPSRLDVALASTYRKANGRFRYLYLVNNHLKLIQYKAVRPIDPMDRAALLSMPVKPRCGLDWLD